MLKTGDVVKLNRTKLEHSWLMNDDRCYLFDLSFEIIEITKHTKTCLLKVIDSELKGNDKLTYGEITTFFINKDFKNLDLDSFMTRHIGWLEIDKKHIRNEKINELCQ